MLTDRDLKEELYALSAETVGDGFVSAILTFGGSLGKDEKGHYLSYVTPDSHLAWSFATYLGARYGYHAEVAIVDPNDRRKNRVFSVEVRGKVAVETLADLGKVETEEGRIASCDLGVKSRVPAKDLAEYVRGVYLSVGRLTRAADGLRLELTFELESDANAFCLLMKRSKIPLGRSTKGDRYTLGTRRGQTVSDFLALMGASKSVFVVEDMIVKKYMDSKTARAGNLLLANTDKSVSAAVRQYEDAIVLRDGSGGFIGVPKEIREVAEARIAHPDVSLEELATKLSGTITKSGLYHRLQKMRDLAQKIREERK